MLVYILVSCLLFFVSFFLFLFTIIVKTVDIIACFLFQVCNVCSAFFSLLIQLLCGFSSNRRLFNLFTSECNVVRKNLQFVFMHPVVNALKIMQYLCSYKCIRLNMVLIFVVVLLMIIMI